MQVVKLIHEEGVVVGRVSSDDFQLVLGGPCDTYCVGDHPCGDRVPMKPLCPRRGTVNEPLPFFALLALVLGC